MGMFRRKKGESDADAIRRMWDKKNADDMKRLRKENKEAKKKLNDSINDMRPGNGTSEKNKS